MGNVSSFQQYHFKALSFQASLSILKQKLQQQLQLLRTSSTLIMTPMQDCSRRCNIYQASAGVRHERESMSRTGPRSGAETAESSAPEMMLHRHLRSPSPYPNSDSSKRENLAARRRTFPPRPHTTMVSQKLCCLQLRSLKLEITTSSPDRSKVYSTSFISLTSLRHP